MLITSKELSTLALKFIPNGAFTFSTECFDIDFNVVDGECKDDALNFINAVITANNAKALEKLEPAFKLAWDNVDYAYRILDNKTGVQISDADCYSADQVAALVQERDAALDRVKELEIQLTILRVAVKTDRIEWEDFPQMSRQAFEKLLKE